MALAGVLICLAVRETASTSGRGAWKALPDAHLRITDRGLYPASTPPHDTGQMIVVTNQGSLRTCAPVATLPLLRDHARPPPHDRLLTLEVSRLLRQSHTKLLSMDEMRTYQGIWLSPTSLLSRVVLLQMVSSRKIRLMVSSRCTDKIQFGGRDVELSEVRKQLKIVLEGENLFGEQLLEVWINEDAPPEEGTTDSWDTCLKQVDDADIVIVLYNGNAGWTAMSGGIGICHAELERGLSQAGAKVRLIEITPLTPKPQDRDNRFRDYVAAQSLFRGGTVSTGEELIKRAKETVVAAITHQVHLGVREARKGKYHLGAALDWTRLDFIRRKKQIEETIMACLGGPTSDRTIVQTFPGGKVLCVVHAVPDSFSTSEAREMVGRPYLDDYTLVNNDPLRDRHTSGPVHIIGVHKSMTESQARSFMGHPNVISVMAPFGFYLADRVEHVQTLVITGCRDESATRHGVQRCLDWLNQSGEGTRVAERAKSRKAILKEIAKHAV